jgi:hypothetical protein
VRGRDLTRGDLLVGSGGLIFLAAMVLPWFRLGGITYRGIDFIVTGIVPLLLIAATIVLLVLDEHTEVDLGSTSVPWPTVRSAMPWLAVALVLVRLAYPPTYETMDLFGQGVSVDLDARPGIYLAVFAAATVGVGLLFKAWDLGEAGGAGAEAPPPGDPSPEDPSS